MKNTTEKIIDKIQYLAENTDQYSINSIKKELAKIIEMLQELSYFDEDIKDDPVKIRLIYALLHNIQNKDLTKVPLGHIKLFLAFLAGQVDAILNY